MSMRQIYGHYRSACLLSILEGGALAKESIIEGRAINLALLDKNLLLRDHCPRRIFKDLRCNSVLVRTLGSAAKYSINVDGTSAKSVEHLNITLKISRMQVCKKRS